MKPTRLLSIGLLIANAILLTATPHWLGCATPAREVYHEPTNPGLYNSTGWQGAGVYFANPNADGTAYAIDCDGTVGHPFTLGGPTALAIPTHHWSSNTSVKAGSLPPGLAMTDTGDITGIPTERGHWIVTLECSNRETNGQTYYGFTQQVRFHITGSGEVNQ